MGQPDFDLIVIGAGPGGYVAAIRAAQLGLKTACVEFEPELGGTCLRVGCIPSKALLESSELFHQAGHDFAEHGISVPAPELDLPAMMARKVKTVDGLTGGVAFLFKKNGVTRLNGLGSFTGPQEADGTWKIRVAGPDGESVHSAQRVLIATGSKVAGLKGVEVDGERVVTSTEALAFDAVPNKLCVIGAGAIGLELGSVWSRLGAEVEVYEYADRILAGMDPDLSKHAQRAFKKQGLKFHLGARVTGARADGDGAILEVDGRDPVHCDRVLLAVGRVPNTDGLNLEAAGIAVDERGRIPVGGHFETSVPNVCAIGDVIAGPMLAHKAEEEGVACVEHWVTGYGHVNYGAIPNVVYTHPEVSSVGATEPELKEAGTPYKVGTFPFSANGRARALGQTEGLVKLIAHAETDRLLGAHIVGPRAGDLIAECAVAMEFGASAEDIARSCHAHPTLPECVKEAALAVHERALHA
ncbi:MAG: dihydrolipoyl dehydrogenase [Planctomycetota bacterium]|jgi:dihydrolipoamide dehydrogenase